MYAQLVSHDKTDGEEVVTPVPLSPDYFLRFKVMVAISTSPCFASESGNSLMDAIALLAYSSAKARV